MSDDISPQTHPHTSCSPHFHLHTSRSPPHPRDHTDLHVRRRRLEVELHASLVLLHPQELVIHLRVARRRKINTCVESITCMYICSRTFPILREKQASKSPAACLTDLIYPSTPPHTSCRTFLTLDSTSTLSLHHRPSSVLRSPAVGGGWRWLEVVGGGWRWLSV